MSDIESQMLKNGLIKVPVDEKSAGKESPYRKVAKFLFIIGAEQAADVLRQLTKEQIDKVVAELVTVQSIDKKEAYDILNEFNDIYNKNKNLLGGVDTAKTILTEAFGEAKAEKILETAVPPKMPKPFEYLEGMDKDRLSRILQGELPATKAIVLSQLEPKQAAAYISSIEDEDEKKDIILRLAKLKKIDAEVLTQVSEALKKKLADVNLNRTSSVDGVSVLADILRKLDYETGSSILDSLDLEDENLTETIKRKLVTIDDVINMNPKHIQYLISPMTDKELALLIHNQSEEFRKVILANMSKSRAALVLDEEQYMGPVLKRDLNNTVDHFLARVKNEAERGRVIIVKDEDDKFVY